MHKYQNILDQCEAAVRSLEGILTASEFSECMDYVTKYDGWLLGLEFAIDWVTADDRKINEQIFKEFEKAYQLMGLESDTRIQEFKSQIQ